jgi:hypothetical protein
MEFQEQDLQNIEVFLLYVEHQSLWYVALTTLRLTLPTREVEMICERLVQEEQKNKSPP